MEVYRKKDQKKFVIKYVQRAIQSDVDRFLQEYKLYHLIESSYVIKPHEIYLFNNRAYVAIEDMDGGSLEKIVQNG